MDYTAYKATLDKAVAEPETMATCIVNTLEMLQKDSETFGALQSELEKYKEKVRALQDTNTELFLRISQPDTRRNETEKDLIETVMEAQFEGGKAKHV